MTAGVLAALFGFIKTGVTTNAGSTLVSTQDLLNAIAAAVIGGTSLVGGRGSAWAAVLGALVVGAINNGLYLIGFNSDAQQIITALVLLTAVVVDALSRRGQRYVGRGAGWLRRADPLAARGPVARGPFDAKWSARGDRRCRAPAPAGALLIWGFL